MSNSWRILYGVLYDDVNGIMVSEFGSFYTCFLFILQIRCLGVGPSDPNSKTHYFHFVSAMISICCTAHLKSHLFPSDLLTLLLIPTFDISSNLKNYFLWWLLFLLLWGTCLGWWFVLPSSSFSLPFYVQHNAAINQIQPMETW